MNKKVVIKVYLVLDLLFLSNPCSLFIHSESNLIKKIVFFRIFQRGTRCKIISACQTFRFFFFCSLFSMICDTTNYFYVYNGFKKYVYLTIFYISNMQLKIKNEYKYTYFLVKQALTFLIL